MSQPIDLLIDGRVLFNVGISVGNISLRLIVIVVGDKVLHGIFRKKLPEFRAKLGSQGLVVSQHQGGSVHVGNDVCHGKGLTGTCNTQKYLFPQAVF